LLVDSCQQKGEHEIEHSTLGKRCFWRVCVRHCERGGAAAVAGSADAAALLRRRDLPSEPDGMGPLCDAMAPLADGLLGTVAA
jgi:hypothetical protein